MLDFDIRSGPYSYQEKLGLIELRRVIHTALINK